MARPGVDTGSRRENDRCAVGVAAGLNLDTGHIQHNPLLPDGAAGLGAAFAALTQERKNARVVIHRIIASGDWVWAHVNFLNLYTDDPDDLGVAGVGIRRMNADGIALEHWDAPQPVADAVSPVNGHGMF